MTKIEVFDLILDNRKKVYNAGDTLSGYLVLHLAEAMKANNISIHVTGIGEVYWTNMSSINTRGGKVSHSYSTGRFVRSYRNHEAYLKLKRVVYEHDDDTDSSLPAGENKFPFSFKLNKNLPSSLEAGFGKIRYTIKATMSRPWRVVDEEIRRRFTVIGQVDLNDQPNITSPREASVVKSMGNFCFKAGCVSAHLSTDRRGYVPGEFILVSGRVSNTTRNPTKSTRIQLRMHLTFLSHGGRTTKHVRTVSGIKRDPVIGGGENTWTDKKLFIPPLPPSPLGNCNIMAISYFVVLQVETTGFGASDLEIPIKVTIGTKPLHNVRAVYAVAPPEAPGDYGDVTPAGNIEEVIPPPPYYEVSCFTPPPSYDQIFKISDGSDVPEDDTWAPAYPYYTCPQGNDTN